MKPCTTEFLAWCAGFFDGEGCVNINRNVRVRKSTRYALDVSIGQTCQEPLLRIQDVFGGSIAFVDRTARNSRHSAFWVWSLRSKSAEDFLRAIQPFVCVKRSEIEVALQFRKTFSGHSGYHALSEECLKTREDLREQLLGCRNRGRKVAR